MLKIGNQHPAREQISNLGDYWHSPSECLRAISNELAEYGLDVDIDKLPTFMGEEGNAFLPIIAAEPHVMYLDDCDQPQEQTFANGVSFSWYKMRPGKWEIITYIS